VHQSEQSFLINKAECVVAFDLAFNNNINAALAITLGSSIQMSLFVTPSLVLVGSWMDKPMSLSMPPKLSTYRSYDDFQTFRLSKQQLSFCP
jgi:calcium/proton exchanger cax